MGGRGRKIEKKKKRGLYPVGPPKKTPCPRKKLGAPKNQSPPLDAPAQKRDEPPRKKIKNLTAPDPNPAPGKPEKKKKSPAPPLVFFLPPAGEKWGNKKKPQKINPAQKNLRFPRKDPPAPGDQKPGPEKKAAPNPPKLWGRRDLPLPPLGGQKGGPTGFFPAKKPPPGAPPLNKRKNGVFWKWGFQKKGPPPGKK